MNHRILCHLNKFRFCLLSVCLVWPLLFPLRAVRSATVTKSDKGTVVRLPDGAYTVTEPFYYKVEQDDDLHWLAARFYGDARQWKIIYRANRARLRDPNRLEVGQKLLIPASP